MEEAASGLVKPAAKTQARLAATPEAQDSTSLDDIFGFTPKTDNQIVLKAPTPGRCFACGQSYQKGSKVVFVANRGNKHINCSKP